MPPPRTHPMGAALVASVSGIAELAVPASSGRVAKVAFSRRRHFGEPTWRSSLATALFSVDGTGGSTGFLPCAPSGGGGTFASSVEGPLPSLSTTGFSPPASPVCPVSSGGSGAEFNGVTNTADWQRAASSACRFVAAAASASASFFLAEASALSASALLASALSASAFSRRRASSSLRFSCAFYSVASQRSAVGSIRRVVADVSADPMTEAAVTLSRVRGALKQGEQAKT